MCGQLIFCFLKYYDFAKLNSFNTFVHSIYLNVMTRPTYPPRQGVSYIVQIFYSLNIVARFPVGSPGSNGQFNGYKQLELCDNCQHALEVAQI